MSGTKEDSAAIKFLKESGDELRASYLTYMSSRPVLVKDPAVPDPASSVPPAPLVHQPRLVPWLAAAAALGPIVAWFLSAAVGAGSDDKAIETLDVSVRSMASKLERSIEKSTDTSHDLAVAMTELATVVQGLRDDSHDVEVALGVVQGMQGAQGLILIAIETRQDVADADRLRMQQAATNAAWTLEKNSKYVYTLMQQMDVVWSLEGLPAIKEKEDG